MRLTLSPHVGSLGRGRPKTKSVQEGPVSFAVSELGQQALDLQQSNQTCLNPIFCISKDQIWFKIRFSSQAFLLQAAY